MLIYLFTHILLATIISLKTQRKTRMLYHIFQRLFHLNFHFQYKDWISVKLSVIPRHALSRTYMKSYIKADICLFENWLGKYYLLLLPWYLPPSHYLGNIIRKNKHYCLIITELLSESLWSLKKWKPYILATKKKTHYPRTIYYDCYIKHQAFKTIFEISRSKVNFLLSYSASK